jgi:hypothetical protein
LTRRLGDELNLSAWSSDVPGGGGAEASQEGQTIFIDGGLILFADFREPRSSE